jgi:LuxR family maltose regulon positive regulatory protein
VGQRLVDPGDVGSACERFGPLLATKVLVPVAAPGLLARRGLVASLSSASSRLVLVSAPAGWGKTSLMAAWVAAEKGRRPFAFLRLETGDSIGAVFWTYVITALRTVHPALMPSADELLRSPGTDPMRRIVPSLLNELAEIDREMVLVFDDYHVIATDDIHASVSFFIDHLPPSVRLVIATRADPNLPLARLRAAGDLLEIRSHQLGFTESEATELLSNRFGVTINPPSVQVLLGRTEGWPAALQLAGLSLRGAKDPTEVVDRFGGDDRNVVDYLMSEVLGKVSEARLDFLLRTSVLDRLTGPLCDAVADVPDSAATLVDLEQSGLFVIPLDSRRLWYRYHHLFREWLRHQLAARDAAEIPGLHRRASRWYAEHGYLESAIGQAISAGDDDGAASLIDQYLEDWGRAHSSQVRQWLDQLPDDVIEAHALCAAAKCRFELGAGDFSGGLRWAEVAEAALESAPDEVRPIIETTTTLYRAYGELLAGDPDIALAVAREIADRERPGQTDAHALAVGLAGISTFWTIGALEAIPLLQEAAAVRARRSLNDSGVLALLATAFAEVGDWSAAETTAADALALPDPPAHHRFPDRMAAHYGLGMALVARGERDQGIAHIQEGLRLARDWVEPTFIAYGCITLAEATTDYAEKRALVREAHELIAHGRDRGRIASLVAAAERKLVMRRPASSITGTTVFVEPLTDRELDVLRLLRSDLSLREIAGELYISYNTVKDHTKSIYRKLGVSSREAAIEAARDVI